MMNSKLNSQNIKFSLTLGSSHTTLVAANLEDPSLLESGNNWTHYKSQTRLQILGASRISNYEAIKRGIVLNIEALSSSILEAIDDVERQTGLQIENVITCFPCMSAKFDNYKENYTNKNLEIKTSDIDKISQLISNLKAPQGQQFIHTIPGFYCVDGKNEINNPVGMRGQQISLDFHRVLAPISDLHNIGRSCYNSGLKIEKFIYEPLAAAEGALTIDEKEFGCVSISIGAQLTHVAVYLNHFPIFSKEYPLGSNHITKDLAIGLRTTQIEAEKIKKEFGRVFFHSSKDSLEKIEFFGIDGTDVHNVTKNEIIQIIDPRVYEMLETIYIDLKKTNLLAKTTKGLVLTGGGALLNGISITAEKIFSLPARIGNPPSILGSTEGLKSPLWASSIGSFSNIFKNYDEDQIQFNFERQFNFNQIATKVWQKIRNPFH